MARPTGPTRSKAFCVIVAVSVRVSRSTSDTMLSTTPTATYARVPAGLTTTPVGSNTLSGMSTSAARGSVPMTVSTEKPKASSAATYASVRTGLVTMPATGAPEIGIVAVTVTAVGAPGAVVEMTETVPSRKFPMSATGGCASATVAASRVSPSARPRDQRAARLATSVSARSRIGSPSVSGPLTARAGTALETGSRNIPHRKMPCQCGHPRGLTSAAHAGVIPFLILTHRGRPDAALDDPGGARAARRPGGLWRRLRRSEHGERGHLSGHERAEPDHHRGRLVAERDPAIGGGEPGGPAAAPGQRAADRPAGLQRHDHDSRGDRPVDSAVRDGARDDHRLGPGADPRSSQAGHLRVGRSGLLRQHRRQPDPGAARPRGVRHRDRPVTRAVPVVL